MQICKCADVQVKDVQLICRRPLLIPLTIFSSAHLHIKISPHLYMADPDRHAGLKTALF